MLLIAADNTNTVETLEKPAVSETNELSSDLEASKAPENLACDNTQEDDNTAPMEKHDNACSVIKFVGLWASYGKEKV